MAHVTETVTPFTTAYLNMTPNNVNNSAICQLVEESKVEMNGKYMSNTTLSYYLSHLKQIYQQLLW